MEKVISFVVVAASLQMLPQVAYAQSGENLFDRNRNVSVKDRPRPEYDSGGVQVGAFTYSPQLVTNVEFDNNIFATDTNKINDIIIVVQPSVGVQSTWAVHSLSLAADVDHREYTDFGTETVTNYGLSGDGRLDITGSASLGAGVAYRKASEPRTSSGAVNRAAEPVRYDTKSAYISGSYETGRTKFTGLASLGNYDYDDVDLIGGGNADQDFRDQDETNIEGRAAYAISPATAVFARVRYQRQDYASTGVQRDQDGYTLDVGADFDLTDLVRGEIGIGYLERSFKNPAFDKISGFGFSGNLEWFASPLVTVGANVDRSIRAAALAASPAYTATSFGSSVDYEWRRNIILSAGATISEDKYEAIDRLDKRHSLYVGANYLLNRYVGFSANIVNSHQKSTGVDRQSDFDDVKVVFGLTLRR
ncbi:MAG: hypothetical protein COA69_00930 [Robiginitomaculum sp.]|nr:MAG: hypothetical protein COA69_00930 [Robiginitomaculum sp.]